METRPEPTKYGTVTDNSNKTRKPDLVADRMSVLRKHDTYKLLINRKVKMAKFEITVEDNEDGNVTLVINTESEDGPLTNAAVYVILFRELMESGWLDENAAKVCPDLFE